MKNPIVKVPSWLVNQFKITGEDVGPGEIPEGLRYDDLIRFDVGAFRTKTGQNVHVEFEAASGQTNWWNTINIFDLKGELIEQSEAGFDLLGQQEYVMSDGTHIKFKVIEEPFPSGVKEWRPPK